MLLSPQLLLLLGLMALVGERVTAWDNSWDGELLRVCPGLQSVSTIISYHDNGREDRLFRIKCRAPAAPAVTRWTQCHWSGWVNNFDGYVNFNCPANFVIHGIHSYHSNRHEDRRWEFLCCESPAQLRTHGCQETYWVNDWDRQFYWRVPVGRYLTGMRSIHDNGKEDRRFRFTYCQGRKP